MLTKTKTLQLCRFVPFLLLLSFGNTSFSQQKSTYNILTYGAKADGITNNASSIQKAIDAAGAKGGGKVLIPDGTFLTSQLYLKSNVELHLADNAVLLGSAKRLDYDGKIAMSLIIARNLQNVSVTGNGIINGQGRDLVVDLLHQLREGKVDDPQWRIKRPTEKNRPMILSFVDCKQVKITGITLKDAACWVQLYKNCNGVLIDQMKVQSVAYWNNDGIDIVDSKNVHITNSFINAADDAICLKSEDVNNSCDYIYVENCMLRSSANGFKLGTGSLGGFKNITVKNLTVYDTYRSAIALETVDGALLENVNIQNVTAKNTGNAILLRLGHRNQDERYSKLQHVYIAHVKAEIPSGKPDIGYPMEGPPPKVPPHNLVPASITGLPNHPVQDVTLEDIEIVYGGSSDKKVAFVGMESLEKVTENEAGYPEFTMFGELPSWGFYVRHAENIKFNNLKLSYKEDDFRPAIVFDDVKGLKLNNVKIPTVKEVPVLVLNKVTDSSLEKIDLPVDFKKALLKQ
ncbi:MAG: glycoside hydrolase family 28 protein [Janthinobacterium lividum]